MRRIRPTPAKSQTGAIMNERFPQGNPHHEQGSNDGLTVPEQESAPSEQEATYETEPRPTPRIYFTAGLPLRAELTTGAWIDMARPSEDIYDELYAVFGEDETYGPEGVYIWDHEGFGSFGLITGALGLEDVHSIELLAQVARGIAEHGPAFAVWASVHEENPSLFDHFAAAYKGHHENMAAYVRRLFETSQIDQTLRKAVPDALKDFVYVDYAAIGEEMQREGDIIAFPAEDDGVWVFDERA